MQEPSKLQGSVEDRQQRMLGPDCAQQMIRHQEVGSVTSRTEAARDEAKGEQCQKAGLGMVGGHGFHAGHPVTNVQS